MRLRIRLAAIASALALTGGLTLTFAGPASAASGYHLENASTTNEVVGRGVSQSVLLSTSVGDVFETDGCMKAVGVTWCRFEDTDWSGDCLQANVAETTVTLGGCASSDRQYWYWPETDRKGDRTSDE
jgi:hypothetical protein